MAGKRDLNTRLSELLSGNQGGFRLMTLRERRRAVVRSYATYDEYIRQHRSGKSLRQHRSKFPLGGDPVAPWNGPRFIVYAFRIIRLGIVYPVVATGDS